MKTTKITYWTVTAILALLMIFSAYAYFAQPAMADNFKHLGFPPYFRFELAIAKIIGAVVLLLPLHVRIKEWAYAGFTIVFISASTAHYQAGDPLSVCAMPILFLALLAVSYVTLHRSQLNSITGRVNDARSIPV